MRLVLLLLLMAMGACTHAEIEELSHPSTPCCDRLMVGFDEGETSRVQLQRGKTVWNEGDILSVFYRSDVNERWLYQGETGERYGIIMPQEEFVGERPQQGDIVIAYPYNANYEYGDGSLGVVLPATQSYREYSYGVDGNIMVAKSRSDDFVLRNAYGWLSIQLTGAGELVKAITVRGNNSEAMAGSAVVDVATADMRLLTDGGSTSTAVTLDCGNGVRLTESVTSFYIAIVPQRFADGISVEVTFAEGEPMTKRTNKEVTIERNHVQPMAPFAPETTDVKLADRAISFTSPLPVPLPEDCYPLHTGFNHRVLLVDHTGVNCPNCPRVMDGLVALADSDVADSYHEVCVHGGSFASEGSDNAYSYAATVVDSYYYPSGYPNIQFNFFAGEGNNSVVSAFVAGNSAIITSLTKSAGADVGISIAATGDTSAVEGSIAVKAAVAGEYHIAVWLLENGIENYGQRGAKTQSHYIHNSALRDIAGEYDSDDISGDTMGVIAKGESRSCSFRIPVLSTWSVENMDVLVIVSADSGEGYEVVNTARCPVNGSLAYEYINIPEADAQEHEFVYTTTDGQMVLPTELSAFGVEIASNSYENGLGVIALRGELSAVGNGAFRGCTTLASVTLPASVTTIGEEAFAGCTSLAKVTLPEGVRSIQARAFSNTALMSIALPDSVEELGDNVFEGCTSLENIEFGNALASISAGAFAGCSSLVTVALPATIKSVGSRAFYNCDSLFVLDLGDGVQSIGEEAFAECDALGYVVLPASLTMLASRAFYGCDSLSGVYCYATTPPTVDEVNSWSAFDEAATALKIYLPTRAVKNKYVAADGWAEYEASFAMFTATTLIVNDWATMRYKYSFDDCFVLNFTSADMATTVEFYLHIKGGGVTTPLAEGSYPIIDWMSTTTQNYCEGTNGGSKLNGVYLKSGGELVLRAIDGGYAAYFEVTNNDGVSCVGWGVLRK